VIPSDDVQMGTLVSAHQSYESLVEVYRERLAGRGHDHETKAVVAVTIASRPTVCRQPLDPACGRCIVRWCHQLDQQPRTNQHLQYRRAVGGRCHGLEGNRVEHRVWTATAERTAHEVRDRVALRVGVSRHDRILTETRRPAQVLARRLDAVRHPA
jgi:hypothetical protein